MMLAVGGIIISQISADESKMSIITDVFFFIIDDLLKFTERKKKIYRIVSSQKMRRLEELCFL